MQEEEVPSLLAAHGEPMTSLVPERAQVSWIVAQDQHTVTDDLHFSGLGAQYTEM